MDPKQADKAIYFTCAICALVVKGPTECGSCQSLFCTECISPWRVKNQSCPKKCKGNERVEFREVHRYVMNCLNMLKFKCRNEHCDETHHYTEAMDHLASCDLLLKPCTQNCGLGILG